MPKHTPMPPLERLHELFEVVPIPESQFGIQSGLINKFWRGGTALAGRRAGNLQPNPGKKDRFDWVVLVDKTNYLVSRIVFYMVNGIDPGNAKIDHKDQNPLNNNITNLRLADNSLQGHNRAKRYDNTSGAVGGSWRNDAKTWRVSLNNKGSCIFRRSFRCKLKAANAYNEKVIELNLDKIGKPLNDLESISCECADCCSDS
jgi:hypothetical protein